MELRLLWIVIVAQIVVTAGILLLLPRIARRGLLFGVYVGERQWESDEVRRITRAWNVGMVFALAGSLILGLVLAGRYPASPAGPFVAIFALLVVYPLLYLRAHFQARALAGPDLVSSAAAPLVPDRPAHVAWPVLAIAFGVVGGAFAIGQAALHYGEMPPRVPTHFGFAGTPDQWSPRSFWTVMLLPFGTLFLGASLGGIALLTARAKRAIRARDQGISIDAQIRFRTAMTRFLSGIGILTTLMLLLLSVASVRVAIGQAQTLPPIFMALTAALLVYALGGTLYLMFHYGQGGARLERRAAAAPLTDGLADNRRWVLGVFYVNRDDPSVFVEKRFGLGYTINFGNPKAVAIVVAFFVLIGLFVLAGILTSGS